MYKRSEYRNGERGDKMSFEEALDKVGFGLYSYILICLSGVIIISFACVAYSNTIIIPTSACELETTTFQQGILAATPVIGLILGGVFWGYVADVIGRRRTLIVSLLSAAIVNAIASISVNWIMLMALQFLVAMLASSQFSLSVTILSESVPMAKRNLVVMLVTSILLLSKGIQSVLANPVIPLTFSFHSYDLDIYWNSWRSLTVLYSIPSIISAFWLYFMQESPKFVYTRGNEKEALRILKIIHRINKGNSVKLQINGFKYDGIPGTGKSHTKNQIMPLFRPPLFKYTVIMTTLFLFQQIGAYLIWLPTITNQFVKIFRTGQGSDLSLCEIIEASLDAPANPEIAPCALKVSSLLIVLIIGVFHSTVNVFISLIVNRVGRRNMAIIITGVCGLSGIIVNFVPNAIGSAVLFVIFLSGFLVIGLYTAIAVALFPTQLRALAVSFTITGSRIGSFAAVQIVNYLLEANCLLEVVTNLINLISSTMLFHCELVEIWVSGQFMSDVVKPPKRPSIRFCSDSICPAG